MVTLILSWPPLWDLLPQQRLAPAKDLAPPRYQVRMYCLSDYALEGKGFQKLSLLAQAFCMWKCLLSDEDWTAAEFHKCAESKQSTVLCFM